MQLLIIDENNQRSDLIKLIKKAADKLNINTRVIDACRPIPELNKDEHYLLYRVIGSNYRNAANVEFSLFNKYHCVSFAQDYPLPRGDSMKFFQMANMPLPPTRHIKEYNESSIIKAVEEVGGFPIIVRAPHRLSLGVGIIKVNCMETLRNLIKFCFQTRTNNREVCLQKFLEHDKTYRIIVLGDEVITSIATYVNKNEFRSNRKINDNIEPHSSKIICSEKIKKVAINAAKTLRRDFVGVDVIMTKDEQVYLLEANFPCRFNRSQNITGVDVARKMLEALIKKHNDYYRLEKINDINKASLKLLILTSSTFTNRHIEEKIAKAANEIGLNAEIISERSNLSRLSKSTHYLIYNNIQDLDLQLKLIEHFSCTTINDSSQRYFNPDKLHQALSENQISYQGKIKLDNTSHTNIARQFEKIDDFPVILEARSSAKKKQIYIDNMHTLISVYDYLELSHSHIYISKKHDSIKSGMMIILNNHILCEFQVFTKEENGELCELMTIHSFDKEVKKTILHIIELSELKLGAVYFTINKNNQIVISKIIDRPPIHSAHGVSGKNIQGSIIEFLYKKYQKRLLDNNKRNHVA